MTPESMDLIFHALASRARRAILDIVRDQPGCCVQDVCAHFDVSRIMILKHLRILEETQLIVLKKAGRKTELYFNAIPIQLIYDRWTSDYSSYWASKVVDLKMLIESECTNPPAPPKSSSRKTKSHESK
jgi:DNA-binding transcriptional ArsR family regulator